MTFLPIVQRELRVSARKRSTFWLRVVAALVGLVIGGGCLMIFSLGAQGTPGLGQVMFGMLTWMALITALASGLFFTSDCLSEEKREGTLGFLFLTDLKGYDVAGGKLLATSVRASYAFLAIMPMLAATLLMGGVTGTAFWKTSLALVNALVASLAAGLFVSSISRDSHKAMGGTLLLLLVIMVGGPVVDFILAQAHSTAHLPFFSLGSAAYAYGLSNAQGRNAFWEALLVSHVLSWVMFGVASLLVARAWQEKRRRSAGIGQARYSWKYGGPGQRARLRRKLMDVDPVMWLACRERWQPLGLWVLVLIVLGIMTAIKLYNVRNEFWMIWKYVDNCLVLGLYLGAASQASRFLVEARRSGMIELLLATPVNGTQIARGSWLAVVRMFALPIGILLLANLVANGFAYSSTWGNLSAMVSGQQPGFAIAAASTIFGCLTTLGNLAALVWFGMWMGMTSRSANLATLKTFLLVQVAPWLVIGFISMTAGAWMLFPGLSRIRSGASGGVPAIYAWFPVIITAFACMLSLGKDVSFIVWARNQLYTKFRERAAMIPGMPAIPPLVMRPAMSPPPPLLNAELKP
jgi:hypothetical protein